MGRSNFSTNEEYNAYMREYRKNNHDKILEIKHRSDKKLGYFYQKWRQDTRLDAQNAMYQVRQALKSGLLTKQPCEVCGSEEVVAHHDNYNKPLIVKWYCRSHHRAIHYGDTRKPRSLNRGQSRMLRRSNRDE